MILDWRSHPMGPPRPCVDGCGKTTPLRDRVERGKEVSWVARHKVCAEKAAQRRPAQQEDEMTL